MSDPMGGVRHIIENARAFQQEANEILAREEQHRVVPAPYGPLLIGLGGKIAAGKDTVADFLVSHHGFEKLGMSDPLAMALYTLNPWIGERYSEAGHYVEQIRYREIADEIGYTEAKKIPEVRRLLQVLGTEIGRLQLGENTWTNVAARRISEIRAAGVPVVLTGVRFENEAAMIEQLGGFLVYVERPQPNLLAFGDDKAPPAENLGEAVVKAIDDALDPARAQHHASEVTLTAERFDFLIRNEGTLADLQQHTTSLVETAEGMLT